MEWKGLEADMTHEHRQQNGFLIVEQSDENTLSLINLPDVVLEAILSNLTYDEISKNRIVRSVIFFIYFTTNIHICISAIKAPHYCSYYCSLLSLCR